jgi:hypothetical protein
MTEMAAFDSAFGDLAISETTLALHMPADHVTQWQEKISMVAFVLVKLF